jgi:hypothetical protein
LVWPYLIRRGGILRKNGGQCAVFLNEKPQAAKNLTKEGLVFFRGLLEICIGEDRSDCNNFSSFIFLIRVIIGLYCPNISTVSSKRRQ